MFGLAEDELASNEAHWSMGVKKVKVNQSHYRSGGDQKVPGN